MGKKVKFHGKIEYSGWDGDKPVNFAPGDTLEVSDAKAEQLLADFPHDFALASGKPKKGPKAFGAPGEANEVESASTDEAEAEDAEPAADEAE